jgi:hypothetical protein
MPEPSGAQRSPLCLCIGNCESVTGSSHWYCNLVDNGIYPGNPLLHSVGAYVSIAVDPLTLFIAIAHYNSTAGDLNLAKERRQSFFTTLNW